MIVNSLRCLNGKGEPPEATMLVVRQAVVPTCQRTIRSQPQVTYDQFIDGEQTWPEVKIAMADAK